MGATRRQLVIWDLISLGISGPMALLVRLDGQAALNYLDQWLLILLVGIPATLLIFHRFGMYSRLWQYASSSDAMDVLGAATVQYLAVTAAIYVLQLSHFPRSALVIAWACSVALVGGRRFYFKWEQDKISDRRIAVTGGVPTLVIGAGDAGQMLIKEIRRHPELHHQLVGVLDDDPSKKGLSVHGVPVLGRLAELRAWAVELSVRQIVIAIPSAPGQVIRQVIRDAHALAIKANTVPGLYEIVGGKVDIAHLRPVQLEDLLRREPVVLDVEAIGAYIKGRSVLVTGAGGSIGSEICRQIIKYGPQSIILLGRGENSIHTIHSELARLCRDTTIRLGRVIADVRDVEALERVYLKYRPDVVFHAAAHKHVSLMEENPVEAIKNNISGTKNVAELALKHGVQRFVMISTDKAVNPSSIMGATKRGAELVVDSLVGKGKTLFMSVRFGNVLGSRGSVVPIFRDQIARGGPVTVTHPDMKRYFMTIPEAVQLVLQAGAMGQGGEVFLLDMGEPISILDMARDLIRLSGFEPDVDIQIEFTGINDGEKLSEELLTAAEGTIATRHEKIFVCNKPGASQMVVDAMIDELVAKCRQNDVTNQELIDTIMRRVRSMEQPRTRQGANVQAQQLASFQDS